MFSDCLSRRILVGLKSRLKKRGEIDNEARISKKAKMKRKFNRNQKRITVRHPAKLFNILTERLGDMRALRESPGDIGEVEMSACI